MRGAPSVSVLLTTYRHAGFVREALESLRSQTCQDFETVIIDDASDDGTAEIIAAWLAETGFPARFIVNHSNRGICANRNTALALARGEFVCTLAGDDAYLPNRIERQLASFAHFDNDVAGLCNDVMPIDEQGRPLSPSYFALRLDGGALPEDVFTHLLTKPNFIPAPGVMLRRSAIAAVGGYDETLFFDDLDMWLRLADRFRLVTLTEPVLRYRVLSANPSRNWQHRARMDASEFRLLSKWIGRFPAQEEALQKRLWKLARRSLFTAPSAVCREMMWVIATSSPSLLRRLQARLVSFEPIPSLCQIGAASTAWLHPIANHLSNTLS